MKTGDRLTIFDGKGQEVEGVIAKMEESSVHITVLNRRQDQASAKGPRIILACAIPKKAKFEFIIEKATELGVDEIIPMQTMRTEVIVRGERKDRKDARYQTVAVNAAKQCGRSVVPQIAPVSLLSDVIKNAGETTAKLIPCLIEDRKPLREALSEIRNASSILFLIGPEGDFTPQEVEMAMKAGFVAVSLGSTVLKVDTAALTVVACTRMFACQ